MTPEELVAYQSKHFTEFESPPTFVVCDPKSKRFLVLQHGQLVIQCIWNGQEEKKKAENLIYTACVVLGQSDMDKAVVFDHMGCARVASVESLSYMGKYDDTQWVASLFPLINGLTKKKQSDSIENFKASFIELKAVIGYILSFYGCMPLSLNKYLPILREIGGVRLASNKTLRSDIRGKFEQIIEMYGLPNTTPESMYNALVDFKGNIEFWKDNKIIPESWPIATSDIVERPVEGYMFLDNFEFKYVHNDYVKYVSNGSWGKSGAWNCSIVFDGVTHRFSFKYGKEVSEALCNDWIMVHGPVPFVPVVVPATKTKKQPKRKKSTDEVVEIMSEDEAPAVKSKSRRGKARRAIEESDAEEEVPVISAVPTAEVPVGNQDDEDFELQREVLELVRFANEMQGGQSGGGGGSGWTGSGDTPTPPVSPRVVAGAAAGTQAVAGTLAAAGPSTPESRMYLDGTRVGSIDNFEALKQHLDAYPGSRVPLRYFSHRYLREIATERQKSKKMTTVDPEYPQFGLDNPAVIEKMCEYQRGNDHVIFEDSNPKQGSVDVYLERLAHMNAVQVDRKFSSDFDLGGDEHLLLGPPAMVLQVPPHKNVPHVEVQRAYKSDGWSLTMSQVSQGGISLSLCESSGGLVGTVQKRREDWVKFQNGEEVDSVLRVTPQHPFHCLLYEAYKSMYKSLLQFTDDPSVNQDSDWSFGFISRSHVDIAKNFKRKLEDSDERVQRSADAKINLYPQAVVKFVKDIFECGMRPGKSKERTFTIPQEHALFYVIKELGDIPLNIKMLTYDTCEVKKGDLLYDFFAMWYPRRSDECFEFCYGSSVERPYFLVVEWVDFHKTRHSGDKWGIGEQRIALIKDKWDELKRPEVKRCVDYFSQAFGIQNPLKSLTHHMFSFCGRRFSDRSIRKVFEDCEVILGWDVQVFYQLMGRREFASKVIGRLMLESDKYISKTTPLLTRFDSSEYLDLVKDSDGMLKMWGPDSSSEILKTTKSMSYQDHWRTACYPQMVSKIGLKYNAINLDILFSEVEMWYERARGFGYDKPIAVRFKKDSDNHTLYKSLEQAFGFADWSDKHLTVFDRNSLGHIWAIKATCFDDTQPSLLSKTRDRKVIAVRANIEQIIDELGAHIRHDYTKYSGVIKRYIGNIADSLVRNDVVKPVQADQASPCIATIASTRGKRLRNVVDPGAYKDACDTDGDESDGSSPSQSLAVVAAVKGNIQPFSAQYVRNLDPIKDAWKSPVPVGCIFGFNPVCIPMYRYVWPQLQRPLVRKLSSHQMVPVLDSRCMTKFQDFVLAYQERMASVMTTTTKPKPKKQRKVSGDGVVSSTTMGVAGISTVSSDGSGTVNADSLLGVDLDKLDELLPTDPNDPMNQALSNAILGLPQIQSVGFTKPRTAAEAISQSRSYLGGFDPTKPLKVGVDDRFFPQAGSRYIPVYPSTLANPLADPTAPGGAKEAVRQAGRINQGSRRFFYSRTAKSILSQPSVVLTGPPAVAQVGNMQVIMAPPVVQVQQVPQVPQVPQVGQVQQVEQVQQGQLADPDDPLSVVSGIGELFPGVPSPGTLVQTWSPNPPAGGAGGAGGA